MNRLAQETSPYLRQHADNPVDWYPWGDEALAAARAQDKPILLSIGYSACHWCHVMAHESFEDEATAKVMNALFVNIKVDREERPDLDKLYQLAHQALVQRGGGWPLTVFLTPDDLLPFFAGTYFPNTPRHGMPPFTYVLEQIRQWYDTKPEQIREQNRSLKDLLDQHASADAGAAGALDAKPLAAALTQLTRGYDAQWGGFGRAPKFPHCGDMELLLKRANDREPEWRAMVERTLECMARGGIHDQLGGGFSRYSVDERWAIPHFEKMLYDNAQLLPLYARGAQLFERADFAAAARGIVEWLEREMAAPEGGYYAALDADSEGEEGKFYVWQREEARALLDAEEWALAAPLWGFDEPANFEDHAWNPIVAMPLGELAQRLKIAPEAAAGLIESARTKLFAARAMRVRPGTDDKVLTAWNALLAAGIARAARCRSPLADDALPDGPTNGSPASGLLHRADRILDFLRARVRGSDGRLHASYQGGRARFAGYLDDHAFVLDALMEHLQCRFEPARLTWAIELAEILLDRFEDRERGGFFFTAHDHERLIARQKPFADESLPSGNAVAVRALLRLGHLLGEPRYLDAAERALRAARKALDELPHASCALLVGLHDFLNPPKQVVIRLDGSAADAGWKAAAERLQADDGEVYVVRAECGELPGLLGERKPLPGGVAYVCRGFECSAPVRDAGAL